MQTTGHSRAEGAGPLDSERADLLKFSALLIQLVGIIWVVHRFQIESTAFLDLTVLTVVGFVIHYFLPFRYRVPFFLLLSITGIFWVMGGVSGAWVLGLGLGLIGLAHLPIRIAGRFAALLLAGGSLFLIRTQFEAPWSAAVWPILASMFMFRMIVYMYDQAAGQGQATLSQRLSYFFLLPNVCFPLFPVVDFRAFVRNYYSAPRHEIHQTGIEWIGRGIVQLLLYRVVHLWFATSPSEVDSLLSLAYYFVWLYLLYLMISGQFHVIAGILLLFGFNLPETHRRYYLASSFNDFWRRINIYWKDFMMKVFYYPAFFRLRRFGTTLALVLSTTGVFVATWALHAYQSFWIRGFFHFTWNDTLFWAILSVLVVINSLYEMRFGRRRTLSGQVVGFRHNIGVVLRTVATFSTICVLWAFWSSESWSSWLSLWPLAMEGPKGDWLRLSGVVAALFLTLGVSITWWSWIARRPEPAFSLRVAKGVGLLMVLGMLSMPAVYEPLGTLGEVMASIRTPRLNAFQLEELERGYYEDLLVVDRFNRELGALYAKRPPDWERTLVDLGVYRRDAPPGEHLVSNAEVRYRGAIFRTNGFGIHDKDYALEPDPGTYRVALLGASHVMGMGVPREATFEAVLEDRLNAGAATAGDRRIEILNFAFNNFHAFDQLHLLEHKVVAFKPNSVWYVGHPYELKRIVRHIRATVQKAAPHPTWVADLATRAGVDEDTSVYLAERRLVRFADEIFTTLFRAIVDFCRQHQMRPVYVHMPLTPDSRNEVDETPYVDLARRAGFDTMDLSGVYSGYGPVEIWIAEWDAHPNELGHQLVADRLHDLIQQSGAGIFGLERSSAADSGAHRGSPQFQRVGPSRTETEKPAGAVNR